MPITIDPDERAFSISFGQNPQASQEYLVTGTLDEREVYVALGDYAPVTVQGLLRLNLALVSKGNGVWRATASYGLGQRDGGAGPGDGTGQGNDQHQPSTSDAMGPETAFDTTGGTTKITQSIATVSSAKADADSRGFPAVKQAIGFDGKKVEGTEIHTPKFTWQETWTYPIGAITWGYAQQLKKLTGKVNQQKFRNAEAGEVIFLGGTGAAQGQDKYKVTYHFAQEENRLGDPDAGGRGIRIAPGFGYVEKRGWEYLWVYYERGAGTDALFAVPRCVFVEQVYEYDDLSKIGIGK